MSEDRIVIGRIVKPQGIKGELKVMPITDHPERFYELEEVNISESGEAKQVVACDLRKGFVYMLLEGVDSRNDAEALRGCYLNVDREKAVKLEEGRHFIADLIGCVIKNEDGKPLGTLKDVLQLGAADVYVVQAVRPFSFPAIRKVISSVDIDEKIIIVDSAEFEKVIIYED